MAGSKAKSYQPTGARLDPKTRAKIAKLHLDGYSYAFISRKLGVDRRRVSGICKAMMSGAPNNRGEAFVRARLSEAEPDPIHPGQLSDDARRALTDFGFYRARYFGRVSTPWQEAAAYRVLEMLETPDKEYTVINVAPGSGKSTLFTHDIPSWVACRNRTIRCLIGSRTYRQARWYTGRLRRTFERTEVLPPDEEAIGMGLAVEPEASLVMDYGRFRPASNFSRDVWRAEEFVIAQPGDVLISEKEASFAAFGMDGGILGGRFRLVVWDDLVDRKNSRNPETLRELAEWYDDVAETRLEPGGLLVLQGQRMRADDLYHHALVQLGGDPDAEDADRPPKYHHIVFKAHYPEVCRGAGSHRRDAPPFRPRPDGTPDPAGGCLLDPRRLPWRELSAIRSNRMEKFQVLYQQEDVDPAAVLVPKIWVDGGTDPDTGETFPGCWDDGRAAWELPRNLVGPTHIFAACDPSPTMYWSVQAWAWNAPTEQLFLLDHTRKKMDAPEFLDWNPSTNAFSGLADEWQQLSRDRGVPITHWIVEANAAQRFLLQYEFVKQWQRVNRVVIVPHQTQRNKTDPEYGVQSIAPLWRHGLVRLPTGKTLRYEMARLGSVALVDEVTRYPDSATDDCVMAMWMGVFNLQRLFRRRQSQVRKSRRPSWLRSPAA